MTTPLIPIPYVIDRYNHREIVPSRLVFYSEYPNNVFFVFFNRTKHCWQLAEFESGLYFVEGRNKEEVINRGLGILLDAVYLESELDEVINSDIKRYDRNF